MSISRMGSWIQGTHPRLDRPARVEQLSAYRSVPMTCHGVCQPAWVRRGIPTSHDTIIVRLSLRGDSKSAQRLRPAPCQGEDHEFESRLPLHIEHAYGHTNPRAGTCATSQLVDWSHFENRCLRRSTVFRHFGVVGRQTVF